MQMDSKKITAPSIIEDAISKNTEQKGKAEKIQETVLSTIKELKIATEKDKSKETQQTIKNHLKEKQLEEESKKKETKK